MTDLAKEQEDLGRKLASDLTTGLNVMSYEGEFIKGFCQGMGQQHRTLQQNAGRLVIAWLIHVGNGGFDGRNEGLVEFARSIDKQLHNAYLPFV